MRMGAHRIAAVLAISLAPTAGRSQLRPEVPTGSRITVNPEQVEAARAGSIRQRFAQCLYRKNPQAAAALLTNSDPGKVDLARASIKSVNDKFGMERCLGDQTTVDQSALGLRMPLATIRSMLAEQAYLAVVTLRPTLPTEAIERSFVSEGEALARAQGLAAFSDCVVFEDVAGADALVRTVPGSSAESSAARALAPALGKCLEEGQNITLNAKSIRMFVADGLWVRFGRPAIRS